MSPEETPPSSKETRSSIISSVAKPLGFYVLVLLMMEGLLGISLPMLSPVFRDWLAVGLFVLLVITVAIVSFAVLYRPEILFVSSDGVEHSKPHLEAGTARLAGVGRNNTPQRKKLPRVVTLEQAFLALSAICYFIFTVVMTATGVIGFEGEPFLPKLAAILVISIVLYLFVGLGSGLLFIAYRAFSPRSRGSFFKRLILLSVGIGLGSFALQTIFYLSKYMMLGLVGNPFVGGLLCAGTLVGIRLMDEARAQSQLGHSVES